MWSEHLGADGGRDEPEAGYGRAFDPRWVLRLLFFPPVEIHGAGERSHHDELREGNTGLDGQLGRRGESVRLIGGQAEDE